MEEFQIFCDGGARGNPGPAASAFVVIDLLGNTVVKKGFFLGTTTNNQAEYQAVILALEYLNENYPNGTLSFFLDSQLVVNQINGLFKVRDENLIQKNMQINDLINQRKNKNISFTYIPRAKNFFADKLVNSTLDNIDSKKRP